MAYFYGIKSNYLHKQYERYAIRSLSLTITTIAFGVFVLGITIGRYENALVQILLIVASLILTAFLFGLVPEWVKQLNSYKKGITGERAVFDILTQLPREYSIYTNITLPGNQADIDCIVVGPTGIFALEIKSHRGTIGFDGTELTLNGQRFKYKLLTRLQYSYWDLGKYLQMETGFSVFITPIIVFSDEKASLRLGMSRIRSIYVINKSWLLKAIGQSQWFEYYNQQEAINTALQQLASA